MKKQIPKFMLYTKPDNETVTLLLPNQRAALCLFSRPRLAWEFKNKVPDVKDMEVGGPMTTEELLEELAKQPDGGFVASDPEPEGDSVYCVEASRLREAVKQGETEIDFEVIPLELHR